MRRFPALLLAAWLALGTAHAQPVPAADHHQHVFSPAVAAFITSVGTRRFDPIDAADVVAHLDRAGIRKAVLLSVGYLYANPIRDLADERERLRAENDFTAAQAARYPGRLVGFCGLNPLKDYALEELERCARDPNLRHGLKLHVGNSGIRLEDPAHAARLREVFRAANARGMAIAIHLRANIGRKDPYGAEQARAFLEVLAAAPDVAVQVAHMAGSGPGYDDPPAHAVMAVLAEAMEQRDPRTRNLWLDVASVAHPANSPEADALLVKLIRQAGAGRVLYGTDAATGDNLRPREAWEAFRRLPLTAGEHARIAANVAPYLR